ncbi:MAG: hypothetical protein O9327_14990 [Polaromonas sp.]|nr:hypothetical protein [Polaromonas sp.]
MGTPPGMTTTSSYEDGTFQARWRDADVLKMAIQGFKMWVAESCSAGQMSLRGDGTLALTPALSDAFCIGMVDFRHFLGVPDGDAFWFNIPVRGIGVDPQAGAVAVCLGPIDRLAAGGEELSEVALILEVDPAVYCARVAMHPYIDLRSITKYEHGISIARMTFDSVPTFITDITRGSKGIAMDASEVEFPERTTKHRTVGQI